VGAKRGAHQKGRREAISSFAGGGGVGDPGAEAETVAQCRDRAQRAEAVAGENGQGPEPAERWDGGLTLSNRKAEVSEGPLGGGGERASEKPRLELAPERLGRANAKGKTGTIERDGEGSGGAGGLLGAGKNTTGVWPGRREGRTSG